MGAEQSSVRATHFQNETEREEPPDVEDGPTNHISISNKMVERLVEDAALAGGAGRAGGAIETASPTPTKHTQRKTHKDRMITEKLRSLDDSHSERTGLTVEEVKATARRVEMRSAMLMTRKPVCEACEEKVVECYASCARPTDAAKCYETVRAFSKCVQETANTRLHARTRKDALEAARRTRHVAQAREHALRDLGPPPHEIPT